MTGTEWMHMVKRIFLFSAFFALLMPFSAQADDKKISAVRVRFALSGDAGEQAAGASADEAALSSEEWAERIPQIDIKERSETRYSVGELQRLEVFAADLPETDEDGGATGKSGRSSNILSQEDIGDLLLWNDTWAAERRSGNYIYALELNASEGYYFPDLTADKIHLDGFSAVLDRTERYNDRHSFVLFLHFPELADVLGAVGHAAWDTESGSASWSAAEGAYKYEVRLKRGSRLIGKIMQTGATRLNVTPLLTEPGSYTFEVRPVSAAGADGAWVGSDTLTIDAAGASANLAAYHAADKKAGWQKSADGRSWYRNEDGTWPQASWLQDAGLWYYFDADGWLVTDQIISWGKAS